MKLSNQAIGAIMMALQNSLMEQSDIVPVLKGFNLVKSPYTSRWGTKDGEIVVDLDDGDNYTPKGKLITLIKKIPKRKKVSE